MEHYTRETWSDYARGLAPDATVRALRAHLDGGCVRCSRKLAVFEALRRLADSDRGLTPPAGGVRTVKAMFRLDRADAAPVRSALRLVFDSQRTPVAGTRSGSPDSERNLVYESEGVALSLSLKHGGDALEVAGGLTDRDGEPLAGVPVALSHSGGHRAHSLSGAGGDFVLSDLPPGGLDLRLLLDDRRVELALPRPEGCAP